MPKQRYALDAGGPKRIEVSWGAFFQNCAVRMDRNVVGTIPGRNDLKAGRDFLLPDGSTLHIQLAGSFLTQEVRVLRDGAPLPGSASDPAERLKTAYGVLFFLGGLNVVVGLLATLAQVDFLLALGIGPASSVEGLIYLILGFFVRRRSAVALAMAVVLLALDSAATLAAASGSGAVVGALFVRIVFLVYLMQGYGALKTLRRARSRA